MSVQPEDSVHKANEVVRSVAALLPFAVELEADMGYTGALVIDLGRRGDVDDPPDTASIDLEVYPAVWMFDVRGGYETLASSYGLDSDPDAVAQWIVEQAYRTGSPVAKQTENPSAG